LTVIKPHEKETRTLPTTGHHRRLHVRQELMGSDAEQILRLAPVPVLLVRAKDA
jgi:hypothetical protein